MTSGLGEGLDQRTLRRALVQHESGAFVLAAPPIVDWAQVTTERLPDRDAALIF